MIKSVESSQTESGKGLKKLAVMALNVALRMLLNRYEGKTDKQKNPFQENSLSWAAWIIAGIGGWKGYRRADPAGQITMRRGLEIFSNLFDGWLLCEMCA
ncbi:MAG: hypothetical protein BWK80_56510 [Desulfobacteraceae bacterium IS3]|nr:MAG: hypothetical protein BWK80_56510 [Desulfobacteraceae bacterium IS3]HAO22653.1 hypothetical protein [Desulfobacteraceae bacterium]